MKHMNASVINKCPIIVPFANLSLEIEFQLNKYCENENDKMEEWQC